MRFFTPEDFRGHVRGRGFVDCALLCFLHTEEGCVDLSGKGEFKQPNN